MSKNKLAKVAGLLMVITIISKIIGFFRDALIAGAFGATYQTDAYLMALTIPYMFFEIFGLAITTTFIPILSESFVKNGKKDMFNLANSIMNILLIISLIASVVGWYFTPEFVRLLAPKFAEKTYTLTVYLTRLSIVNILFLSMNSGFMAILQALDDFASSALVGIVMNIPVILYIIMGNKYGITGLTIATIIGNGTQLLVYIPWLVKNKYKYSFKIVYKDTRIKKMFLLIAPILIGISVDKINSIVNKIVASGLAEGTIASLDFANKLNSMIYYTFASAIVTVIYPTLSREGNSECFDDFKRYLSKAVISVSLLMIPSSIGMIILRVPLINILFKHGAFDMRAVEMTSVALLYLSIGMIFFGIRDIYNRAFYALQDTKTPMINGIIGVVINIILNLTLAPHMGIGGLTLSTSVSAIVCSILLVKDLRKKIGNINLKEILISIMKIVIASLIMGAVIFMLQISLNGKVAGLKADLSLLVLAVIVGLIVYSVILTLLKEKEFIRFSKIIIKKLKIL